MNLIILMNPIILENIYLLWGLTLIAYQVNMIVNKQPTQAHNLAVGYTDQVVGLGLILNLLSKWNSNFIYLESAVKKLNRIIRDIFNP